MNKLWGGRFTKSAEEWVDEFGASISFDQELVMEDINWQHRACDDACQNRYFDLLKKQNKSNKGLETLKVQASNDELEFSVAIEDIHLNLESKLTDLNWTSRWKASYRSKS